LELFECLNEQERLLGKAYVPLADIVNSPGATVTEKYVGMLTPWIR
jgi:hypothetical protein